MELRSWTTKKPKEVQLNETNKGTKEAQTCKFTQNTTLYKATLKDTIMVCDCVIKLKITYIKGDPNN